MLFSRIAAATVGIFVLSSAALVPSSASASPKHKAKSEVSKPAKSTRTTSKAHKSNKKSDDEGRNSGLVHHALVRVSTAKLRSAPGEKSHATALLDEGRSAKVIAKRDGWAKIRLDSGREGWVRHDLLNVAKKAVRDTDQTSAKTSRSSKKHQEVAATPKKSKKQVIMAAKHTIIAKKQAAAAKPTLSKAEQKAAHVANLAAQTAQTKKHQMNLAAQENQRKHATSAQAALHAQHQAEAALHAAKVRANENAAHLARLATHEKRAQAIAARKSTQNAAALAALDHAKAVREARAADATDGESTFAANITDARGDRLVRNALSYRGTPYRMGATGRGAFDCSGFTMYLFSKEGESLPRTAAEQFNHGKPVDKADMQIGDLVFFKNTYKHGVSHVGVFIGNGHFIHASSGSHQVTVTSLSESYYVNHWAGARRPR